MIHHLLIHYFFRTYSYLVTGILSDHWADVQYVPGNSRRFLFKGDPAHRIGMQLSHTRYYNRLALFQELPELVYIFLHFELRDSRYQELFLRDPFHQTSVVRQCFLKCDDLSRRGYCFIGNIVTCRGMRQFKHA